MSRDKIDFCYEKKNPLLGENKIVTWLVMQQQCLENVIAVGLEVRVA